MPFKPASDALKHLTVIDLTRVRAGPTCVRQLADWGANVIKVEMPETAGESMGGARDGSDFLNLHRNKRSITLDLKKPEGVEILKQLVRRADVLVENYRPDVKFRLGIDYETLKKINPRLVYGSISGFGQDGPYRDRPGFDQVAQGMGASAFPLPTLPAVSSAPWASSWRSWSARCPAKGSGCRARSSRRRSSCWISRRRAGSSTTKCRPRPATTIPPAFPPACSRPATATSTSRPPAATYGCASARLWRRRSF